MYLPNYRDGSIVNLMQSILAGLDAPGHDAVHGHLADLAPEEIADARHVVLLVVDGLGQAQLDAGPAPRGPPGRSRTRRRAGSRPTSIASVSTPRLVAATRRGSSNSGGWRHRSA